MPDVQQIVFLGDIHGEFRTATFLLREYDIKNTAIIQVGDFGMGFYRPNYYRTEFMLMNRKLALRNNHLYAIRGNHDDPSYFAKTNHPFGYGHITLLADYSEIELLGKKFLCVGGAISIDRVERIADEPKKGKSYWEDEPFVYRSDFDYKSYDCVVTHSRPVQSGLFIEGYKNAARIDNDPTLLNDIHEEGRRISLLYDRTVPPLWVFGHFHESRISVNNSTKFKCCEIKELYPYRF